MGFFDGYKAEPYHSTLVKDGKYEATIIKAEPGQKDDLEYVRVDLKIQTEGNPELVYWITKGGKNFNGLLTAFYDTFGITRGNSEFYKWEGRTGRVEVKTTVGKDGTKRNKVALILNEDGYADNVHQKVEESKPEAEIY